MSETCRDCVHSLPSDVPNHVRCCCRFLICRVPAWVERAAANWLSTQGLADFNDAIDYIRDAGTGMYLDKAPIVSEHLADQCGQFDTIESVRDYDES